jgi:hypothetical protein
MSGSGSGGAQRPWHSWSGWAGWGGVIAVIGIIVTVVLNFLPQQESTATPPVSDPVVSKKIQSTMQANLPSPTASPKTAIATTRAMDSSDVDSVTESAVEQTKAPSIKTSQQISSIKTVFLSDLPDESFIRWPFDPDTGTAVIQGTSFPKSYSWEFSNCGSCTNNLELKTPAGTTRLVGRIGLTDDTRHDAVIDGRVSFTIYASGEVIYGPKEIEYPQSAKINVKYPIGSRLTIEVQDGDNYEDPCLCSMKLTT